jgi:hypothetical protein
MRTPNARGAAYAFIRLNGCDHETTAFPNPNGDVKMIARTPLALMGLALLAACAGDGGSRPQPSAPPAAAQPAPPDVGFSADVSDDAVSKCRLELDSMTDGAVQVTGTEFSQANSAVYMVVGDNRAPWKCLIDAEGRGDPYLEFIGSEGAL